jgi:hypothetical protein
VSIPYSQRWALCRQVSPEAAPAPTSPYSQATAQFKFLGATLMHRVKSFLLQERRIISFYHLPCVCLAHSRRSPSNRAGHSISTGSFVFEHWGPKPGPWQIYIFRSVMLFTLVWGLTGSKLLSCEVLFYLKRSPLSSLPTSVVTPGCTARPLVAPRCLLGSPLWASGADIPIGAGVS